MEFGENSPKCCYKSNDIALQSALTAGHPRKLARSGPGDEVMNP